MLASAKAASVSAPCSCSPCARTACLMGDERRHAALHVLDDVVEPERGLVEERRRGVGVVGAELLCGRLASLRRRATPSLPRGAAARCAEFTPRIHALRRVRAPFTPAHFVLVVAQIQLDDLAARRPSAASKGHEHGAIFADELRDDSAVACIDQRQGDGRAPTRARVSVRPTWSHQQLRELERWGRACSSRSPRHARTCRRPTTTLALASGDTMRKRHLQGAAASGALSTAPSLGHTGHLSVLATSSSSTRRRGRRSRWASSPSFPARRRTRRPTRALRSGSPRSAGSTRRAPRAAATTTSLRPLVHVRRAAAEPPERVYCRARLQRLRPVDRSATHPKSPSDRPARRASAGGGPRSGDRVDLVARRRALRARAAPGAGRSGRPPPLSGQTTAVMGKPGAYTALFPFGRPYLLVRAFQTQTLSNSFAIANSCCTRGPRRAPQARSSSSLFCPFIS